MGFGADHGGAGVYGPLVIGEGDGDPIVVDTPLTDALSNFRPFVNEDVLRARIAAEIAALATDDSDVSDAYRHAAMIAAGTL